MSTFGSSDSTSKYLVIIVHKGGAVIWDSLGFVEWVPLEVQQTASNLFRAAMMVMMAMMTMMTIMVMMVMI